ncbi:uncharacterized protein LOC21390095 isoform X2 [Morus notabilis]|uniref:uncharacterized protein LOC21390095 isoform X2 n=1 Tax=Morus notabilis TaxID=981085 RepID=UPI000CED146D|nr:uncharacterized protein LOC21390095 isoform X2 [Morus notabilis]
MSHSWVRALSARKKNFVLGLFRRKTISLPHTLEPRNSLGSTSAIHNCDEFSSILRSLLIGTASRDRNCCRSFSSLHHCIVEDTGEVRKPFLQQASCKLDHVLSLS